MMQKGSEKVHLVVRTINSSAFSQHDWDEYVVDVSSLLHLINSISGHTGLVKVLLPRQPNDNRANTDTTRNQRHRGTGPARGARPSVSAAPSTS